jgi:hypothetical protein
MAMLHIVFVAFDPDSWIMCETTVFCPNMYIDTNTTLVVLYQHSFNFNHVSCAKLNEESDCMFEGHKEANSSKRPRTYAVD